MGRNIFLIGNPVAGRNGLVRIKKAASIFDNQGHNVKLLLTAKKGDAESFARQISIERQLEPSDSESLLVIAAGGDGTYNEVANGLLFSGIPMGVLPLGTTSVLAREIGMPKNINDAVSALINGPIKTVHLGRVAYHDSSTNSPAVRCFLLMAGIGFDGEAVHGVNDKIKRYIGKGAYVISGIMTLLRYNPIIFQMKCRGQIISAGRDMRISVFKDEGVPIMDKLVINAYNAIISKASCYGGDFKVTPDADISKPFFHVFAAQGSGRLSLLRYAIGVIRGKHLGFEDVCYFKTSEIDITGQGRIQIDGDYLGDLPAKMDILPEALKLVFVD